jgi:hypothetical protein
LKNTVSKQLLGDKKVKNYLFCKFAIIYITSYICASTVNNGGGMRSAGLQSTYVHFVHYLLFYQVRQASRAFGQTHSLRSFGLIGGACGLANVFANRMGFYHN